MAKYKPTGSDGILLLDNNRLTVSANESAVGPAVNPLLRPPLPGYCIRRVPFHARLILLDGDGQSAGAGDSTCKSSDQVLE